MKVAGGCDFGVRTTTLGFRAVGLAVGGDSGGQPTVGTGSVLGAASHTEVAQWDLYKVRFTMVWQQVLLFLPVRRRF